MKEIKLPECVAIKYSVDVSDIKTSIQQLELDAIQSVEQQNGNIEIPFSNASHGTVLSSNVSHGTVPSSNVSLGTVPSPTNASHGIVPSSNLFHGNAGECFYIALAYFFFLKSWCNVNSLFKPWLCC